MKASLLRIAALCLFCILCIWLLIARPISISNAAKPHNIDTTRLKEAVRVISEEFHPRSSDNPANLKALSQYIADQFKFNTSHVSFQNITVDGQNYRNVIAHFGPDTQNIIVVGAHYDAYSSLPGADDNATGVVGLIELSRLLSNINLSTQVQLVAYTLEEPPYFATENMGSYVHAHSLRKMDVQVKLMISLEMIGFFSEEKDSQSYPMPLLSIMYPSKGDFIAVVDQLWSGKALQVKSAINQHTAIQAYSINAPTYITGIDFSDHRNYWAFGYPAVMVTDTAFYRNKAYHTEEDTYERLNYHKMANVILGVFKVIEQLTSETLSAVS